jgi:hypothetical protein
MPSIVAAVGYDATNDTYALGINGSNFGISETVDIVVLCSIEYSPGVVENGAPIFLTANTDPFVGGFHASGSGDGLYGLCPIGVALGESQPLQTFNVTATGSTSKKTASATTTFTCPEGLIVPGGD